MSIRGILLLVAAIQAVLSGQAPAKSAAGPTMLLIRQRALDPEALKKEGAKAAGCEVTRVATTIEDLRGATSTSEERLKSMSVTGAGTVSGLPSEQGRLTDSRSLRAGRMAVSAALIEPNDRIPRYFEPTERISAKEFAVLGEDGKSHPLTEYRGKVVLLFLFRTDCRWTLDMLGEVLRMQGLEDKAGIKVLPVSVVNLGWPPVKEFRRLAGSDLPASFPIFLPSDQDKAGLQVLGDLKVAPTTLILDREGQIAWRINGATQGSLADKLNLVRMTP